MSQQEIERSRKLLLSLTDPTIKPFIDVHKVFRSSIFTQALDMAIIHAKQHGDLSYLNKIFLLIEKTRYESLFLENLSSRLERKVGVSEGGLRLSKSPVIAKKPIALTSASPVVTRPESSSRNKQTVIEKRTSTGSEEKDEKARSAGFRAHVAR